MIECTSVISKKKKTFSLHTTEIHVTNGEFQQREFINGRSSKHYCIMFSTQKIVNEREQSGYCIASYFRATYSWRANIKNIKENLVDKFSRIPRTAERFAFTIDESMRHSLVHWTRFHDVDTRKCIFYTVLSHSLPTISEVDSQGPLLVHYFSIIVFHFNILIITNVEDSVEMYFSFRSYLVRRTFRSARYNTLDFRTCRLSKWMYPLYFYIVSEK